MAQPIQGPLNVGNLRTITTYRAGILQASSVRALRKHCDRVLAPYGITKSEWLIVGAALDAGQEGITLKELAPQLDTTITRLNSAVQSLEARGKVLTCAAKTVSKKSICINPAFALDCAEIERSLRTDLRETIYANVSPLEFRIYLKVLYQLSLLK